VVASPQLVCAVRGGPREPRKREACSDRCRTALSRVRKARAVAAHDQQLRLLLAEALRLLDREPQGTGR